MDMANGSGSSIDLAREEPFRIGNLQVDPPLRRVSTGETLEPRVMQVLVALARARGAVISRDELIRTCWGGRIVGEDSINRVISRLRRLAVELGDNAFTIETVPKIGYRLIGDVRALDASLSTTDRSSAAPHASRRRPLPLVGIAAAVAAIVAVCGVTWLGFKDRDPVHTTVHYLGFSKLGTGVAVALPSAIDEAVLSAFSDDSDVTISRAPTTRDITLAGTLSDDGSIFRVSSRIEHAATGGVLWSKVYEQPSDHAPQIADWVAAHTTSVARCGLSQADSYGRPLSDRVKALIFAQCAAEMEPGGSRIHRAIDLARQITLAAPDFAGGWANLGYDEVVYAVTLPAAQAAPLLTDAAPNISKALELDPENPRAWEARAFTVPPNDLVAVDKAFRRATEARPSWCGCAMTRYGWFLRNVGRGREARAMLNRAIEIMPLQPMPVQGLLQLDAAAGRYREARNGIARVASLTLDDRLKADVQGSAAIWMKDYDGGIAAMSGKMGDPAMIAATTRGFQALKSGDTATRLAAAQNLAEVNANCGCDNSFTVRMQAALGDSEGALANLSKLAVGRPDHILSTIAWDPVLDRVRHLPDFAALTERVGLLGYWRVMRVKPDFCGEAGPPPVCRLI